VDVVLLVDAYHEFDRPWEMMRSIVRALKPGGRVALVEFRAEDSSVPIKALHKMTEAQARRELEAAGLSWIGTDARLAATPSASIGDSDAYRAIVDRAGVPTDVTGIAYVNAAQLQAQAATMGAKAPAGMDALKGVVAWGTADGATLFISIG
jgi:SAM-dependent methyltransferase